MSKEDGGPDETSYYDVDKFKKVLNAQASKSPPTGFRLFLIRLGSSLDSVRGFISTFIVMLTVFAAPLVVVIGALYGLVGFLASFLGVIGLLSFYVEKKVGRSMRVDDSNLGMKIVAQILGCGLVLVAFYLIFVVALHLKFS